MTMYHVMLDCESFSLKPNAAICTIGAVQFDPHSDSMFLPGFHEGIKLQSSLDAGLVMDADTVRWWMQQPDAARGNLITKLQAGSELKTVLGEFTFWLATIGDKRDVTLWSCGSRDFEWLEASYQAVKLPVPWHYRVRDYRTIRDTFGTPADEPPATTRHDALADAIWQARYLQNVMKRLRKQATDAAVYAADHYTGGDVTRWSDEDNHTHITHRNG